MKDFIKRMIEEHADLQIKIFKLDEFIYSGKAKEVCSPEDYANACIQLKAMRNYEEALRARLSNNGVIENDGKYHEQVGEIIVIDNETPKDDTEGSDLDRKCKPDDDNSKCACTAKLIFFD